MTDLSHSRPANGASILGVSKIKHSRRYTSGDVRLWDTFHWDSGASNLLPAQGIGAETPTPHVSLVRVTDTVACAAYENGECFCGSRFIYIIYIYTVYITTVPDRNASECLGCVDVWSTESIGEPIHHYQHLQQVCALALSTDAPVVTSASGSQVRVDTPDDRGYWRTVRLAQLSKPVSR